MSTSAKKLLENAKDEAEISQAAFKALTVVDLGAQIQAGLGISVDDVPSSEVFLLTLLIDDSSSIRFEGNSQIVRDGYNAILEALSASKQADNILVHTRYLHGKILQPYLPLVQSVKMDSSNFDPNGDTPLCKQTAVILGTALAKTQEFEENGVVVRSATFIVTDGADNASGRVTAKSVEAIVRDMLKTEKHIVGGMGIDDHYTDFKGIFKNMGIDDRWILTPGNTPSEIRKAFQVISKSALRASQAKSPQSFSQTAIGGFGN